MNKSGRLSESDLKFCLVISAMFRLTGTHPKLASAMLRRIADDYDAAMKDSPLPNQEEDR